MTVMKKLLGGAALFCALNSVGFAMDNVPFSYYAKVGTDYVTNTTINVKLLINDPVNGISNYEINRTNVPVDNFGTFKFDLRDYTINPLNDQWSKLQSVSGNATMTVQTGVSGSYTTVGVIQLKQYLNDMQTGIGTYITNKGLYVDASHELFWGNLNDDGTVDTHLYNLGQYVAHNPNGILMTNGEKAGYYGLEHGHILVGDGSGYPQSVNVTGAIYLNDDGVTTLQEKVVKNINLDDNAVTTDKIANGTIAGEDLNPAINITTTGTVKAGKFDGDITLGSVALPDNHIISGNASNVAEATAITGDVTYNHGDIQINAGVVGNNEIANGAINNAKVATDAAIDGTKIVPTFDKDVTTTGNVSGVKGTFTGDVSGANGTFTGDVSAANVTATAKVKGDAGDFNTLTAKTISGVDELTAKTITATEKLNSNGNTVIGTDATNTLTVNATTTVANPMTTNGITNTGAITSKGDLTNTGKLTNNGDVTITGTTTAANVNAQAITGTDEHLTGNLTVDGNSILGDKPTEDNVTINAKKTIVNMSNSDQEFTIHNTLGNNDALKITGDATSNAIDIHAATRITGETKIAGNTTLSGTTLDVNNNNVNFNNNDRINVTADKAVVNIGNLTETFTTKTVNAGTTNINGATENYTGSTINYGTTAINVNNGSVLAPEAGKGVVRANEFVMDPTTELVDQKGVNLYELANKDINGTTNNMLYYEQPTTPGAIGQWTYANLKSKAGLKMTKDLAIPRYDAIKGELVDGSMTDDSKGNVTVTKGNGTAPMLAVGENIHIGEETRGYALSVKKDDSRAVAGVYDNGTVQHIGNIVETGSDPTTAKFAGNVITLDSDIPTALSSFVSAGPSLIVKNADKTNFIVSPTGNTVLGGDIFLGNDASGNPGVNLYKGTEAAGFGYSNSGGMSMGVMSNTNNPTHAKLAGSIIASTTTAPTGYAVGPALAVSSIDGGTKFFADQNGDVLMHNLKANNIVAAGDGKFKTLGVGTNNTEFTVDAAGNTYANGTLKADGAATLNGATTVNNTLTVADGKATTLGGTLEVKDKSTLADVDAKNTKIDGTLEVTGKSTLADVDAKNTKIDGTLGVTGLSNLNGGIAVNNGTKDVFTVDKTTGNTKIDGTLTQNGATATLNGATTVNNTLTVADGKATTLGGTLEVKDKATLDKDLLVKGEAQLANGKVVINEAMPEEEGRITVKNQANEDKVWIGANATGGDGMDVNLKNADVKVGGTDTDFGAVVVGKTGTAYANQAAGAGNIKTSTDPSISTGIGLAVMNGANYKFIADKNGNVAAADSKVIIAKGGQEEGYIVAKYGDKNVFAVGDGGTADHYGMTISQPTGNGNQATVSAGGDAKDGKVGVIVEDANGYVGMGVDKAGTTGMNLILNDKTNGNALAADQKGNVTVGTTTTNVGNFTVNGSIANNPANIKDGILTLGASGMTETNKTGIKVYDGSFTTDPAFSVGSNNDGTNNGFGAEVRNTEGNAGMGFAQLAANKHAITSGVYTGTKAAGSAIKTDGNAETLLGAKDKNAAENGPVLFTTDGTAKNQDTRQGGVGFIADQKGNVTNYGKISSMFSGIAGQEVVLGWDDKAASSTNKANPSSILIYDGEEATTSSDNGDILIDGHASMISGVKTVDVTRDNARTTRGAVKTNTFEVWHGKAQDPENADNYKIVEAISNGTNPGLYSKGYTSMTGNTKIGDNVADKLDIASTTSVTGPFTAQGGSQLNGSVVIGTGVSGAVESLTVNSNATFNGTASFADAHYTNISATHFNGGDFNGDVKASTLKIGNASVVGDVWSATDVNGNGAWKPVISVIDKNSIGIDQIKNQPESTIIIGQGTGTPLASYPMSGDVTMTKGGVVTIADNAITSAKINDGEVKTDDIANLNVTEGKLAIDAVTSAKIKDGEVKTDDIADLNVTEGKLAANAVTSAKIKDATIVNADIADNAAIGVAKIAAGTVGVTSLLTSNGTTNTWENNINLGTGTVTAATFTGNLTGDVTGTADAAKAVTTAAGASVVAAINAQTDKINWANITPDANLAYKNVDNAFTTSQTVTGTVTATGFSGPLTGNVTGTADAAKSVTTDAAASIKAALENTPTVLGNTVLPADVVYTGTTGNIAANAATATLATTATTANGVAASAGNSIAAALNDAATTTLISGAKVDLTVATTKVPTAGTADEATLADKATIANALTNVAADMPAAGVSAINAINAAGTGTIDGTKLNLATATSKVPTAGTADNATLATTATTANGVAASAGNSIAAALNDAATTTLISGAKVDLTVATTKVPTAGTADEAAKANTVDATLAAASVVSAVNNAAVNSVHGSQVDLTSATTKVPTAGTADAATLANKATIANALTNVAADMPAAGVSAINAINAAGTGTIDGTKLNLATATSKVPTAGTADAAKSVTTDAGASVVAAINAQAGKINWANITPDANLAYKNVDNAFTTSQTVTGTVTATGFSGPLTGNVTGTADAAKSVTTDAAASIKAALENTPTVLGKTVLPADVVYTTTTGNIAANAATATTATTANSVAATAGTSVITAINNAATTGQIDQARLNLTGFVPATATNLTAGGANNVYLGGAANNNWGLIADANVSGTAAIAGTKINPNFGAQNIVTTGTINAGASTLASLAVTNNATVGGTLGVTGKSTLADVDASGVITSTVAAGADALLSANGNITLTNGNLNVAKGKIVYGGVGVATGMPLVSINAAGELQYQKLTADGIATGAITTDQILDGTIQNADIKDQTIVSFKLAPMNSGEILIGQGAGNNVTSAYLSGDVTMTNAGLVTIANNAVTTVKILDKNVTTDKIADNAVTMDKLAKGDAGTVLTGQGTANPAYASTVALGVAGTTAGALTVNGIGTATPAAITVGDATNNGNVTVHGVVTGAQRVGVQTYASSEAFTTAMANDIAKGIALFNVTLDADVSLPTAPAGTIIYVYNRGSLHTINGVNVDSGKIMSLICIDGTNWKPISLY